MLTINIEKTELKKAFFGETPEFSQSLDMRSETTEDLDVVLLKIMLENYEPKDMKEAS